MYQNIGMPIIFLSSAVLLLSLISLIFPIKPLGFKTRGRAFWCSLVSFAALIFAGNMLNPDRARVAVSSPIISAPTQTAEEPSCGATMAEFSLLQTGMSYQRVAGLIGCDGSEQASSEVEGYKIVIYSWSGSDGFLANMNATFQNNKLVAKAQLGLK